MINIDLQKKTLLAVKYPKTAWHELVDPFFKYLPHRFPRFVNCFITERCNFNCPMCHVKTSRLKRLTELPLKTLQSFFDSIAPFAPSVSIAGGEPLMHPEIIKIIAYLTQKHIVKCLVTNGMLLEKMAPKLIDAGLDFLAISFDGPDEKTQYQRGLIHGSFNQIIKSINQIIKFRGKNILPNIRIATVISSANINNFDQMYHLALDLGVDQRSISHHFYYYDEIMSQQEKFSQTTGFGNDVWGEYCGHRKILFNSKQRQTISDKLKYIQQLSNSHQTKLKITLPTTMDVDSFYTGRFPNQKSWCLSPFNQVYLRGNGDVELCHGYILGNIKENSLFDLWNSPQTKRFQQYIKTHHLIPACFRCCSLNPVFD